MGLAIEFTVTAKFTDVHRVLIRLMILRLCRCERWVSSKATMGIDGVFAIDVDGVNAAY